jgi:2'-5' RNA ligase
MDNKRIFIGLDLSDAAKAACESHVELLRKMFPDVRVGWELREKLHVTLKFLGNTDSPILSDLEAAVAGIASNHEPFTLRLSRTGVFPRASRPRVLWIGTEDRPAVIQPLYAELEAACESFEYPREEKAFRPHITIGRVRDPYAASGVADAHLERKIEPVEFEVCEIVIYESKLQPTGSVYSTVSRHKLGRIT